MATQFQYQFKNKPKQFNVQTKSWYLFSLWPCCTHWTEVQLHVATQSFSLAASCLHQFVDVIFIIRKFQQDREDMVEFVRNTPTEFKEYYIQMQASKRSQAPLPSEVITNSYLHYSFPHSYGIVLYWQDLNVTIVNFEGQRWQGYSW